MNVLEQYNRQIAAKKHVGSNVSGYLVQVPEMEAKAKLKVLPKL